MRCTKIVGTIGPAVAAPKMLEAVIRAGLDVARLNFSHGTYDQHAVLYQRIKAAAKRAGKEVAILQDLQGPKIRVADLPAEGVRLNPGEEFTLTTLKIPYDVKHRRVTVSYANMHRDLQSCDRLLLDDGLLELEVIKVRGHEIITRVIIGGTLFSHKGVNVPTATLGVDPITKKDKDDLKFGLKLGVDFVALSFVTSPADVRRVKRMIVTGWTDDGPPPLVIVKIEKHEAIEKFDEILAVADGVMVARGDLGIETPPARVPVEQKIIIEKCRRAGKPVIVATQMLDSMMRNPRPTRAEVSDISNAVIDHTDACMLSGETASGKYPLEAVTVMANAIKETEESRFDNLSLEAPQEKQTLAHARTHAALVEAIESGAKALVIASESGEEIRIASSLRPEVPIIALVSKARLARQLSLLWGVRAFEVRVASAREAVALLVRKKIISKKDKIVFLA